MQKIIILLILVSSAIAQPITYTPQFKNQNNKFNWSKGLISSGLLTFSVVSIYETGKPIYYNEARTPFHFTKHDNRLEYYDNGHRGLDKYGHFFASKLFAQNIYYMSRWSGLNNKVASYTSFFLANTIMAAMEVHDAYYERWGFSIGDFLFNVAGAGFYIGQQNYNYLRNFDFKMSYDFTKPEDENSVIESYANMTYWLTANPSGLFNNSPKWIPNWINLALGISITHDNPHKVEVLIGLDYNLKRVRTKSVFLNHLIHLIDNYRFPAPAIRLAPGYIGYGLFF